jgi:peptide/nickel transport system substrate-binding protein
MPTRISTGCAAGASTDGLPVAGMYLAMIRRLILVLCVILLSGLALAEPRHGIAMHGEPALPADFTHLPYANPDAPQGGTLHQALVGSFDSLNPFIVRGQVGSGVRTYVFESLLGRNWDEPFSLYGLLAETIDVSPDRNVITFRLRPEARFSDGSPVTAADIVFSLETLREKGRPNFKNSYAKITRIETPDERTIVFTQTDGDRELPLIIGLMSVFPKHDWENRDFEKTTLAPLIGTGPYVFGEIKPGESIVYRKNKDYWGKDLAINKGAWNFDQIRIDYFRDNNSAFESFKKGLIDIRVETDPGRWSTAYDFDAVAKGDVIRETVEQRSPAATTGFAFNTRRPLFSDIRVRRALLEAFDFEWANANLLANLYHRTYGYYSGSELS